MHYHIAVDFRKVYSDPEIVLSGGLDGFELEDEFEKAIRQVADLTGMGISVRRPKRVVFDDLQMKCIGKPATIRIQSTRFRLATFIAVLFISLRKKHPDR